MITSYKSVFVRQGNIDIWLTVKSNRMEDKKGNRNVVFCANSSKGIQKTHDKNQMHLS